MPLLMSRNSGKREFIRHGLRLTIARISETTRKLIQKLNTDAIYRLVMIYNVSRGRSARRRVIALSAYYLA